MIERILGAILLLTTGALPAISADGIEAKLQICGSCHGKEGTPSDQTVPIIWGQQQAYLEKQLRDYKSGERDSQIMSSLAEGLRDEEISDVAAYFADKRWPRSIDHRMEGPAPDAIPACQACHQVNLLGGLTAGEIAPRLAGQTREYLIDAMRSFADGERDNSAVMAASMKSFSATEREALAHYLSSL